MDISTVQIIEAGFLVNGDVYVPNDIINGDCRKVHSWIKSGGVPSPEFTDQELLAREKEEKRDEAIRYLQDTDWYVSRKADVGKPIPSVIEARRLQARIDADNYMKDKHAYNK